MTNKELRENEIVTEIIYMDSDQIADYIIKREDKSLTDFAEKIKEEIRNSIYNYNSYDGFLYRHCSNIIDKILKEMKEK